MKRLPGLRTSLRTLVGVLLCLAVPRESFAADSYDGARLSIPSLTIGSATYTSTVVTVGAIVSYRGGAPAGSGDSYDPATRQLTIPAVAYGTHTYTNVVVAVASLVSIGSVSGADSYDGTSLVISSVQVSGGARYANVVITVHGVTGVGGGMPGIAMDSYDAATGRLVIGAVQYGGNVYTNVTVTVGTLLAVGGPGACVSMTPTIVCTRSGLVQGAIEGGFRAFRGIPFAAAPVGALRWRPPATPASWLGLRPAMAFGNQCPQTDYNGGVLGDEDCLSVNVFATNPRAAAKLPVMVFFHGGGWKVGSAQYAPFDHIPLLVDNGVIVVTAQYRLGLLGFFAHPLLTTEGSGSSGNYAFMDSIAALQWVHDNIANFGGDPTRVMIFGQSSGSESIQTLLASPAAQGLFARAGMESGADAPGWWGKTLADAYPLYARFVPLAKCDTAADVLACLRALSADAVVLAQLVPGAFPYMAPSIEPRVLPEDSFERLQRLGSPVPLLIGSNSDEDVADEDPSQALDAAGYAALLATQFGSTAGAQVLGLYPATFDSSPRYTYIDVQTDHDYTWETRNLARAASGAQRPAVYRYLFTHRYENDAYLNSLRAFHTAELNFVAGNFQEVYYTALPYTPTQDEVTLSNDIIGYWTRFAASGDPNGPGAVTWRPYDAAAESILQLDVPVAPLPGVGYRNAQCDLLTTLPF